MRRTPRRNTYTTAVGAKKDTLLLEQCTSDQVWRRTCLGWGGGGEGGVEVVRSEGSSEAGWGK